LAVLGTGILKNTTTTGVPSIAVAGDFPTLNQNTSGSSASCTGNAATASAVAVGGITGLGTGVATALAVNVGSAGAPVLFNGAGGTPSSMTATNLTGTATSLNIGGNAATATTAVTVSTTVASGATGTTQTPSDASTKMATTAYVDAAVPPGTVHAYAGTAAPTGYLLCDGGSYLIATYPNLSAVIRATFGGVDGTHFYTPDLRGRGVFGKDDMGGAAASRITAGVSGITGTTLGAAGGSQSLQGHTHTGTTGGQSADHTHTVPLATQTIMSPAVISEVTRSGGSTTSSATSNDHTHSFTSDSTGAGSSQNVPPAIMLNYIIKY
jgi:microcystin-dependent protein